MYSSGGANVKCSGSVVTANGRNFLEEIDAIKEDIEQIKAKIGM
jgi:hypothetical protein